MICKTFYTQNAYNSLGLGYTVESVVGALQISDPIPITDKDAIPPCSIVISKDFSHMGVTIGPYERSTNAVVESAVRYGGVHISQYWTVGDGTRDFFYYCQVTIFDYESEIRHTGPRYLTVEDDP